MGLLRHIISLIVALLFSVLSAVAMPMMPTASHQVEFFPHQRALIAEHINVHFAARAPPLARANVAFTGAAVAELGNGVVMHGHDTVASSLEFAPDFVAPNRGGDAVVPRIGTVNNPNGVRLSTNEQAAADALTANGYDVNVVQRDLGTEGVRRSDFTVNGFGRVDEYTPTNPTQNTVVRGVVDKIGGGQADSVIVNVPSDFSNVDMYSSAVRVFNNPSASNANTLFFLQNGQLRQFDRSVVNNLTGAN